MSDLIFYPLAASVCIFAGLAVTQKNIFHCALYLAMVLLSIAGIYFYLDAPFLGVIQILVYVGGIITLFIFAIKLTAHIEDKVIRQTSQQWVPSLMITGILLCVLFRFISRNSWVTIQSGKSTTLSQIGHSLMTSYAVPFEFISLLLLAAMVGAIVIGKVKK